MRKLIPAITAFFLIVPSSFADNGMVQVKSSHDVATTADNLEQALTSLRIPKGRDVPKLKTRAVDRVEHAPHRPGGRGEARQIAVSHEGRGHPSTSGHRGERPCEAGLRRERGTSLVCREHVDASGHLPSIARPVHLMLGRTPAPSCPS